jgi:hypothetical protein
MSVKVRGQADIPLSLTNWVLRIWNLPSPDDSFEQAELGTCADFPTRFLAKVELNLSPR